MALLKLSAYLSTPNANFIDLRLKKDFLPTESQLKERSVLYANQYARASI